MVYSGTIFYSSILPLSMLKVELTKETVVGLEYLANLLNQKNLYKLAHGFTQVSRQMVFFDRHKSMFLGRHKSKQSINL